MRFSTDWQQDARNAAPEERATVCDFRLWINERNVCQHIDDAESKLYDHITMSIYSLAEGLTHDWWEIFGARDREYMLINSRMGYVTPDVRFRFDGVVFEIYGKERFYQNPGVRFWGSPPELMRRQDAESFLADFVERVIQRLDESNIKETGASLRWRRVRESMNDPEESAFCEAAGALGCDPYNISERKASFIERAGKVFVGEPLIEFLAGLRHQRSSDEVLNWIDAVEARHKSYSCLPDLNALAKQIAEPAADQTNIANIKRWALGYRRARAARAALNMASEHRVRRVSELAKRLGNHAFRRAPSVNGLRALVSHRDDRVHVHLRDRRVGREAVQAELFAFARAVGDALCFPQSRRSVVNDLHEADRQATGRAFAAEFLAPVDEILSMQNDGADVAKIADDLNVSTEVVMRQIENRNRIKEACA